MLGLYLLIGLGSSALWNNTAGSDFGVGTASDSPCAVEEIKRWVMPTPAAVSFNSHDSALPLET